GEGERPKLTLISSQGRLELAAGHVPELHREERGGRIVTPGCQRPAIGRECEVKDRARGPPERRLELAACHIPQARRAVVTPGRQRLAIGREDGHLPAL